LTAWARDVSLSVAVQVTMPMQSRRWIAGVLVALTVAVALEPLVHSDAGHDPHFAIEFHDASQHRFTAPPPDANPLHGSEHCVVCHLFRHSRGSDSRIITADLQPRVVAVSGADDDRRLAAGAAVPLPARAPPARS
jgi:hypothetical protein